MPRTLPAIGWAVFLPPHPLAFAIFCALLAWSAWRLARAIEPTSARLVGLGVWGSALAVAFAQLLSLARQLHWPGLLAVSAVAALIAWRVPAPRRAAPRGSSDDSPPIGQGPDRFGLAVIAAPLAAYGAFALALVLTTTEPCADNALYHLPRLGYWLQHQSTEPFLGNNARLGSFPPNANVLQLVPVLFLRTDRLCALVQLAAFYGAGLAVFGLARDFGASRPGAAGAALCWLTVPTALLQATVSMTDLTTSFFTAAAGMFAVAALRRHGRLNLLTALAAGSLAIGAKPQTAVFVLPAAALVILFAWRREAAMARTLLLASPALFLLAAWPYVQNVAFFGSAGGLRSIEWLVVDPGLPSLAKNLQLMGAHLVLWTRVGFESVFIGPGLGAIWLALVPAGLAGLAWVRFRAREGDRIRLGYFALSLALFLTILFTMRHQPSVTRFVLPAAALLSVAAAFAIDAVPRQARVGAGLLAALAGAVTLAFHARHDIRLRLTERGLECLAKHGWRVRCLAFTSPEGMCGRADRPAALVAEGLARKGPGRRIGLVGSQGYPERLLFGRRFANVLVPLSYGPPSSAADLDRLGLDAVWIEKGGDLPLPLFRLRFVPPKEGPSDWRLRSFFASDDAFEAAARQTLAMSGVRSVRALLENPGWRAQSTGREGLFFERERTRFTERGAAAGASP